MHTAVVVSMILGLFAMSGYYKTTTANKDFQDLDFVGDVTVDAYKCAEKN